MYEQYTVPYQNTNRRIVHGVSLCAGRVCTNSTPCLTRIRTDVSYTVFLCVQDVCVRTVHRALPEYEQTYRTRCFFVCRTCVYEQYTVPYQNTNRRIVHGVSLCAGRVCTNSTPCRTRIRTDVSYTVFLCVQDVCVRTVHRALPEYEQTYRTRCFFVCKTCVYEQYTVPYQNTNRRIDTVFLCVQDVCVRTVHRAVPEYVPTYHTRCFFVCRTCVYEQYTVPYQKTYRRTVKEEVLTRCGPWSWKSCVRTM